MLIDVLLEMLAASEGSYRDRKARYLGVAVASIVFAALLIWFVV